MIVRRAMLPVLVAALIAEGALLFGAISKHFDDHHVLTFEFWAIGGFIAAVLLLAFAERGPLSHRAAIRVVLAGGGVFQLLMLTHPPVDSDDDFRYLWDAKVQLAGIDPYRYAPSSPQLAHLRDGFLFPTGPSCDQHAFAGGCTRLNLPDAHTIYPPVAEAVFALLRILSFGGHGQHLPLQIAAALAVMTISALLARRALAAHLPAWTVAIWAWCPVTAIELVNNAHIDWLAVLLGVLALSAAARGRHVLAGLLVGAGAVTKLYPALLGASMLRRRPLLVIFSAATTVVLAYLPHVIAVGWGVLGYLPDYLQTGGYGDGHQYRLLAWLPGTAATPVAVLIVLVVIGWALLRGDAAHPERSALIVVGAATLVSTPTLPWYTLLLLALVAMNARPEWLGVVIAPTVEYLVVGAHGVDLGRATTLAYSGGVLVLVVGTLLRRHLARGPEQVEVGELVRS